MIEVIVKWLLSPSSISTHTDKQLTKTKESPSSEHQPASDSATAVTTPHHDITTMTHQQAKPDKPVLSDYDQQAKPDKPVLSDYGKPITSSSTNMHQTDYNDLLTSVRRLGIDKGKSLSEKGNSLLIDDLPVNEAADIVSLPYKHNAGRSTLKEQHSMSKRAQPVSMGGSLMQATEMGNLMKGGQKSTAKKFKPRSLSEFEAEEKTIDELASSPTDLSSSVRHTSLSPSAIASNKRETILPNSGPELARRTKELQATHSHGLLLCEDLEDVEFNVGDGPPLTGPPSNQLPAFPRGRLISLETAKVLNT